MNADLEGAIRNIIGFTEDDLSANSDGQLSDSQRNKLIAKRQFWLQMAAFAIGLAVILFIASLVDPRVKYSDKISWTLMICGALALALSYVWLNWVRYTSDFERGIAFATEGELELIADVGGRRLPSYHVRINKTQFTIERRLFNLLDQVARENSFCAIYYTPKSKVILSFEVLDQN